MRKRAHLAAYTSALGFMLRVAPLALIGLALCAPAADAGWKINRALAIAQAVWHPSCGQLTVRFGDPAAATLMEDAAGWAWEGNCEIGIDQGRVWAEFEPLCQVILHEGGHVVGLGHSENPRSVMRAESFTIKTTAVIDGVTETRWDGVDRRCLERGRPSGRSA